VRADRARAASGILVALLLVRSSAAEPSIGPIEVLAHHRHYDRHHDARWPDPFDTPDAACAARDGDRIVVSVQTKLLWLDGDTGRLLRETPPPFATRACAMTFATHGTESVLVYAGVERTKNPADVSVAVEVVSRSGKLVSLTRHRSAMQTSAVDLAVGGKTLYLRGADDSGRGSRILTLDLGSLVAGSFEAPACTGLYADGRSVFMLDDRAAPRGPSTTMQGCPDLRAPPPTSLRPDLSAAIDYARPGAGCDEPEGINLRDGSARVVARRPVPAGAWRFASLLLPWDDGLRVVAQKSDMVGFQIWKVPVEFAR
jgi:hypothetical protein